MIKNKILDSFLKVYEFTIDGVNGKYKRQIVSRTNDGIVDESVAVLLIDIDSDEVIMVKQARFGMFKDTHQVTDGIEHLSMLECVAGTVDYGEDPRECAIREIEEETGYKVDMIYKAINNPLYVSPGLSTEKLHLFIAKCSIKVSEGGGLESENENIEVVKISVSTVDKLISLMDTVVDMKTYLLLSKYKRMKFNV